MSTDNKCKLENQDKESNYRGWRDSTSKVLGLHKMILDSIPSAVYSPQAMLGVIPELRD